MTKNQFIKILNRYSGSTSSEAGDIINLKESYPYSQVLHALSARLSKDHKLPSHQYELQTAAIYAADRAVLKVVMESKPETWPASNEVIGSVHPNHPESMVTHIDHEETSNDLAEELMNDLQRLSELKHNFEQMFADGVKISTKPIKQEIIQENKPELIVNIKEEPTKEEPSKPKPPKRKKAKGKTRAQRIVELAKQMEEENENAELSQDDESENTSTQESKGVDIIQEIKSTKKKIQPETDKQREQLEIINQFIKTQPKIANLKDRDLTSLQNDLTSSQSGDFGDNVISETLVDILLKQGKKDKAIEVLKKLIWKFPQKKGYFAAQIEELKK